MSFTEDELEKQYSASQWSRYSKSDEVLRDFISETVRGSYIARNMIPGSFDVSYGQSENQKVDIFGENKLPKEAPVFVFVHGGFWTSGSRKDSSFPVRPLYEAGILCIVMGYDLITETFLLPELVTQIQCGIKFVLEFAEKRGSRGVYFCGHSAGAHLIAMALSSDPPQEELYKLVKGLVFFSGIYDLMPLLKTSYARAAYITKDVAEFYSPMKAIATFKNNIKHTVHIWIAVAEHDSPAFQKQSEEYAEALQAMGLESVQYCCFCKGLDHFTLVQNLYDKDFFFSKKLVDFIKSKNLNLKHEEVKNKKKTVRKSFDILKNADNVKSMEHLKSPDYLKKECLNSENQKGADKVVNKENKENPKITNNEDSKDVKSKENEDGSKNFEKFGNEKVSTQSSEKIDMKSTCCTMETAANKEIAENEDNRMEVTECEAGDNKDKEKEFNEDKNSEQDSVEDGVNEKLAEIDINKKQTTEFEVSVDMARISKVDNEAETTVCSEAELQGKDKDEANEGQVSDKIATSEENSNETGNDKVAGSQKASEYELTHKDIQSSTPQKATSDGENSQKMAIGSDAEKE